MEENEETVRTKEEVTTCLTHYNLDDGYGSSNSSPHSCVQSQYCSGQKKKKEFPALALKTEDEKRSLEVRLIDGVLKTEAVAPDGGANAERETWGRDADFLLSIIGFAVDLANVWRFPYLCYRNGGGAFLIPYTLMLIFGAVPLFYMELVLGQYNRQGPITVWQICPIFKGVGVCAVVVAFFVSFYYNVIIAWALYFFVGSMHKELPWLFCNNTWNSPDCISYQGPDNQTKENYTREADRSPAAEYFSQGVLEMHKSSGFGDLGYPKWQLALCLFFVYIMLYLSLFKGVKSTGKVVWVTATLPYVVLTILLIRGLMLPGAMTGIKYYLQPELSKLREPQVWVDAAVQIFFSVGAGFGVHLSYASYNNFKNNCFKDAIITSIVNSFTSFFSGFVIFTYLGFMSQKHGIPINDVADEGPGLVFQVYPEAVATLPGSHFWSLLFFFMLMMLGLDSGMGGLECVLTGLMDEYGKRFGRTKHLREGFTAIIVGISFTVALINTTPGGIYFFHMLDTYAAGLSLLCSALFEAIAVSWFYGLERFCQDVQDMIGSKPGIYWRICWKFISPSFLIAVIVSGLVNHETLTYGNYVYPVWAQAIGIGMALTSFLMIPGFACYELMKTKGTNREKMALGISPKVEHEHIRTTGEVSRFRLRHWLYI
ncbi:sodium-dependent noradrenaline transporter [Cimex lectularius]|uniref:Transporter n=1 Tax=Cimex lectularius TaxID=79782 RepID=A0A8I6RDP6_CIMLE|nr:sodium-dependent noradrenaline transporter [Cimex lectularius]